MVKSRLVLALRGKTAAGLGLSIYTHFPVSSCATTRRGLVDFVLRVLIILLRSTQNMTYRLRKRDLTSNDNQRLLAEMMSHIQDNQRAAADSIKQIDQVLSKGYELMDQLHDELIELKYK